MPRSIWMYLNGCGVALLAAVASACSSDPAQVSSADCEGLPAEDLASSPRSSTCPNDLPSESDCDATTPSYQADVASVVAERCNSCHGPDGIEAVLPFSTHAELFDQRRTALSQIFTCQMPPPCALDLTASERATLQKWFVCGALDN